jgi:glycine cleavage system protein P-like pyridoxal-binding family
MPDTNSSDVHHASYLLDMPSTMAVFEKEISSVNKKLHISRQQAVTAFSFLF